MKRLLYFLLGFASCIACLIFIFKKIDKFTSELVRRYNKFEGFFLDKFVVSIKNIYCGTNLFIIIWISCKFIFVWITI